MYRDKTTSLVVTDWPSVGQTTSLSLDGRIYATPEAVEAACRQKYGKGSLERIEGDVDDAAGETGESPSYRYRRSVSMPRDVLRVFSFLLNKSYS